MKRTCIKTHVRGSDEEEMSAPKYFLTQGEQVSGPFSEEQLRSQLASSTQSGTALVWGSGMPEWQNAKTWIATPAGARPANVRSEPVRPVVVAPVKPVVVAPVVRPAPTPVAATKANDETVFIAKPQAKPAPEAATVITPVATVAAKPSSEAETIFMAAAKAPKSADAETVFIGKPTRDDAETVMIARPPKNEPAVDLGESTKVVEGPANELWHFAIAGKSFGPFKRLQLVEELKKVDAVGEVMLWTKGMKEWAHLFEFHEILSAIGVNKRQFPRADLTGLALIKVGSRTLSAQTLTISEGGMGVQMDAGLEPGQPVSLEIQSPVFSAPIQAKATVRYIFDGVMGLKFSQISPEAKTAILTLVRKTNAQFVLKVA